MSAAATGFAFRAGTVRDLRATFTISALGVHHTARRMGVLEGPPPTDDQIESEWASQREVIEFLAAQPDGSYWVCEDDGEPVGYARVCRFAEMEQLTELMVLPGHHGRGIGRALLERCFPDAPTPQLGRLIVAAGATSDLTLYTDFGVMPTTGHWHMRARRDEYVERRGRESDGSEATVHALAPQRAAAAWKGLEPPAVSHRRPALHDFLARTRTCLATVEGEGGEPTALCWVGPDGDLGPAVARSPAELLPVVLAALDRVARTREPHTLGVYCATDSWWLVRRLRRLGFRVHWPGWIMSSIPLPGLDRYLPMRPPHLL